jgi:excinuclease UvrABC nuclease subunit
MELPAPAKLLDATPICGIYFLLLNGSIVYVGQSTNVLQRVWNHQTEGIKEHDSVFYVECSIKLLDSLEQHYIKLYKPRYNKVGNPDYIAVAKPIRWSSSLKGQVHRLELEAMLRGDKNP